VRLSKPVAVLVFLATLVPLGYLAFFLTVIVSDVFSESPGGPPVAFKILFALHLLCMFWMWALMAFYIVYLFKSPAVPKDQRVLWLVLLLFVNMFAMPVFWYLYVWGASTENGAVRSVQ